MKDENVIEQLKIPANFEEEMQIFFPSKARFLANKTREFMLLETVNINVKSLVKKLDTNFFASIAFHTLTATEKIKYTVDLFSMDVCEAFQNGCESVPYEPFRVYWPELEFGDAICSYYLRIINSSMALQILEAPALKMLYFAVLWRVLTVMYVVGVFKTWGNITNGDLKETFSRLEAI